MKSKWVVALFIRHFKYVFELYIDKISIVLEIMSQVNLRKGRTIPLEEDANKTMSNLPANL